MIIQVNGKLRAREIVSVDITEDDMKSIAMTNDAISKYLESGEVVKVIIVPRKLVNIVVK
jgi:leucyl-tRNA synthetase